jgi:hypothetical protein
VTRAEQLSVVVTSALAWTAAFGYVSDAAGLGLAATAGAGACRRGRRNTRLALAAGGAPGHR